MATVIPVIKGRMGSTPYYLAKMSARELVASAHPASEQAEWADFGIEERMQRELNMARVNNELVPYLATSPDRFFGAFVVLIYRGEVVFEGLQELNTKVPAAYKSVAGDLGFLTVDGGELIILDGQHRHAALREVIQGGKVKGEFVGQVPNDDVEVVFIEFDASDPKASNEKIRRIFNKLNRYARPTGRGDNIITSEDDGYAILTRLLVRTGEPLGRKVKEKDGEELIVNWKSNTIAARSVRFTTISAVYETVKVILAAHGINDFDEKARVIRPSDEEIDEAYEHVHRWWDEVLNGVDVFKEAFEDPSKIPSLREAGEPYSLLFKPAAHIILFMALHLAVDRGLSLEHAVRRVNKVDWNLQADHWRGALIQGNGRISARKEHYEVTAELVAYLIGADVMSAEDIAHVTESVARFRDGEARLPQPVAS